MFGINHMISNDFNMIQITPDHNPQTTQHTNTLQNPHFLDSTRNSTTGNPHRGPSGEPYVMTGSRGYCYVCRIDLTSSQHYQQHINGNKHMKKERETEGSFTDLPQVGQFLSQNSPAASGQDSISTMSSAQALNRRGSNGEEYSKADADGICYICNVRFTSKQHAIQHLSGAKHRKKAAAGCIGSGLVSVSASVEQEVIGATGGFTLPHGINESTAALAQQLTLGIASNTGTLQVGPNGEAYIMRGTRGYCYVCQLELTSLSHAQAHVCGQKHQKKCLAEGLDAQAENMIPGPVSGKVLMCSVCQVPFSSLNNAGEHFMSEKHKKKVEMMHQALPGRTIFGDNPEEDSGNLGNISSNADVAALQSPSPITQQVIELCPGTEYPTLGTEVKSSFLAESKSENSSSGRDSGIDETLPPPEDLQGLSAANRSPRSSGVSNVQVSINTSPNWELNYSNHTKLETSEKYINDQNDNLSTSVNVSKLRSKTLDHTLIGKQVVIQRESGGGSEFSRGSGFDKSDLISIDDNNQQEDQNQPYIRTGLNEETELKSIYHDLDPRPERPLPLCSSNQLVMQMPTSRSQFEGGQQLQPSQNHFHGTAVRFEIPIVGEDGQQHLHHQTSRLSHKLPSSAGASAQYGQTSDSVPYYFDGSRGYCRCCSVELTSQQHANQHLNGQKHKKKLAQWELMQALQSDASSFTPPAVLPVFDRTDQPRSNLSVSTQDRRNSVVDGQSYYFNGSRGFCNVCNIELTSSQHTEQHINGKQHKRNQERHNFSQSGQLYPLYCDVCKKSFTGQESARQHFISSKHQAKKELISESAQPLALLDEGRVINKDGQLWYFCDICRIQLNTRAQFEAHRESSKHKKETENHVRHLSGNHFLIADSGNKVLSENEFLDKHGNVQEFTTENGNGVLHKHNENILDLHQLPKDNHSQLTGNPSVGDENDEVRQYAFQDNWHHLIYGEAPTINPLPIQGNGFALGPIVGDCQNLQRTGTVDSKCPILGTGAAYNSADRTDKSGRSHVPTERYSALSTSPQIRSPWLASDFSHHLQASISNPIVPVNGVSSGAIGEDSGRNQSGLSGSGFIWGRPGYEQGNSGSKGGSESKAASGENSDVSIEENEGADGVSKALATHAGLGQLIVRPSQICRSKSSRGQERGRDVLSLERKTYDLPEEDYTLEEDERADFNIQGEEENLTQKMAQLTLGSQGVKPLRSNIPGFRYYCDVCDKHMNTKETYESHLKGKLHMYKLSTKPAPERQLGQIQKIFADVMSIMSNAMYITEIQPRRYQLELVKKAMSGDKIIYLPTGTGKTLVAVMVMGLMLTENKSRPVLFLVDKVLLVLQQAQYIVTQFGEKVFDRPSLTRDGEIESRKLQVKPICGGLTTKTDLPVWKHDIIVTTAAYCANMLEVKQIRWSDFSLVVLDEVHHCNKDHAYHKLLKSFHHLLPPEERPKMMGLTASPAGKDTEEQTYCMLKNLLDNLGGAGMALVEELYSKEALKLHQSSAEIRPVCVPLSSKEKDFKHHLLVHFIQCYIKLVPLSSTLQQKKNNSPLLEALNRPGDMQVASTLAQQFILDPEPLYDVLLDVNEAHCSSTNDEQACQFNVLRSHVTKLLIDIPEVGSSPDCSKNLLRYFEPSEATQMLEKMGLPCKKMYQMVKNFGEDGNKDLTLFNKLIETLKDPTYINWADKSNKALVLVKERRIAKRYAAELQHNYNVSDWRELVIRHLVGHGKGAQDGGMDVKKQKKILDNHDKIDLIVATSIMEEGIDLSDLQLVVCMNPPTSLRALVQMRGRARKQGSYFVVLCNSEEEVKKLSRLQKQERNMEEAALRCLREERTLRDQ